MFEVQKEKCNQCLFTKNRIVSNKRKIDILKQCRKNDTHFVCHKSTIKDKGDVCCRGFYDLNPYATNLMRIAYRLKAISFVSIG